MEEVFVDRSRKKLFKIVRLAIILLVIASILLINKLEDTGQFIKFVLFDVIAVNAVGYVLILGGLFTLIFGVYMLISRKAVNPKGVVLPTIGLSSFFLTLGILLAENTADDFSDVVSFLSGNAMEENVVIQEFRVVSTPEGPLYYYTFEDGRTFEEGYRGKGFEDVKEGESYYVRYLPKTKKLLRIESIRKNS